MINDFGYYELTSEEFDSLVLGDDGLVVVYFRSDTFPLCQDVDQLMNCARQKLSPDVNFWLVDVDRTPALAARYAVNIPPTLLIFKNGNLVDRIAGLPTGTDLVPLIGGWLPNITGPEAGPSRAELEVPRKFSAPAVGKAFPFQPLASGIVPDQTAPIKP